MKLYEIEINDRTYVGTREQIIEHVNKLLDEYIKK